MTSINKNQENPSLSSSNPQLADDVHFEPSPPDIKGSDIEKQPDSKAAFHESDAGDGTKREDQYLTGANLILCVLSTMACMFLVALDQTITVTILTTVSSKFNAFDKVTWITTSFLLAMGCLVQAFGKISIIFGRKWTMVVSIVLFELGSLVSALSSDINMLIGGRTLQGVGGAGIQTCVFIIVSEIVPIDKRPLIMASLATVYSVASVVGPIFGGLFTSHVSWRWCFYINLCCGGLIVPLFLYSFRPKTPLGGLREKLKKIDYLGTFLMISGIVLGLLGLTFGGNDFPWKSGAVISCFVLSGLLSIAFCFWNFAKSKNPILPLELVKIKSILFAVGAISFGYGSFISTFQFTSIYFQVVRDQDALHSGLSLLPYIVPVVLCSVASGIAIQRSRHIKPFSLASGLFLTLGTGLLLLLKVDSTSSKRIGLQIIGGIGVGLLMQGPTISCQINAPKTPGSTILATTFLNFGRNTFAALSSELSQVIYTTTLKKNLHKLSNVTNMDFDILVSNTSLIKNFDPEIQLLLKKQFMTSIYNVYYFCIGLGVLSWICAFFMSSKRLPEKVSNK